MVEAKLALAMILQRFSIADRQGYRLKLLEDRVIVIVTATYNGRAPDSALAVDAGIDAGKFAEATWPDTRFAVLGIGNSPWPNYQAFPKKIDAALEATGAQRLCAG